MLDLRNSEERTVLKFLFRNKIQIRKNIALVKSLTSPLTKVLLISKQEHTETIDACVYLDPDSIRKNKVALILPISLTHYTILDCSTRWNTAQQQSLLPSQFFFKKNNNNKSTAGICIFIERIVSINRSIELNYKKREERRFLCKKSRNKKKCYWR